jgi:hypothetical protein
MLKYVSRNLSKTAISQFMITHSAVLQLSHEEKLTESQEDADGRVLLHFVGNEPRPN